MTGDAISNLELIRTNSGNARTTGLNLDVIRKHCAIDESLGRAISEALDVHQQLILEYGPELLMSEEEQLVTYLQSDLVNFYAPPTVNPYIPLSACGPWIVTSHGAIIHDNGGYGMLGMGHGPDDVIAAMQKNWVMANVMTPSFSHKRLGERLRKEVGHTRESCPFSRFICLNSGSESVALSMRIADANALKMTEIGGRYEGCPIKIIGLEQAFHGRTQRPAQLSDSCRGGYSSNLATFRDLNNVILVPSNDVSALRVAFAQAESDGYFIELVAMEPVMGEGNPGQCVTREFYDEARRLTSKHGSLLFVDSIQAGLRGQGCLSIVDYPGFVDCEAPDFETWSKALNAGQYPLSVVGLSEKAADMYVVGIYGNTMTTNPRALETAIAVLDRVTPELRRNIIDMGRVFVQKLEELSSEFPGCIAKVQGSGLLLCAELDPAQFKVVGFGQVEEWCRFNGLGVIHGGQNALRFTPHFNITSEEIDLIIDVFRSALIHFTK
ncbi:MAG: aminotransferase class III-fold pyridoxal phosphate-dependent enzyme [Euryarchaeota archaeon]|nr:aminotransferase class III-fold pyridoxal phosphate-dependent enzyme [Euryarchaeota archaeon]